MIKVDGLILVSRRSDGKIHVEDDFHTARKGAVWGAVGGAVIGLIFPPTLLAGALVGAGVGGGVGALVSHGDKNAIKAEVEDTLPLNSSGIVALFEEQWASEIDKALPQARKGHQGAGRRSQRGRGQDRCGEEPVGDKPPAPRLLE